MARAPDPSDPRSPSPEDVAAGEALRALREGRGVTRAALAAELAISYEQLRKIETGKNRLTAGRLAQAKRFLDGASAEDLSAADAPGFRETGSGPYAAEPPELSEDARALVTALAQMPDPEDRRALLKYANYLLSESKARAMTRKPARRPSRSARRTD